MEGGEEVDLDELDCERLGATMPKVQLKRDLRYPT